MQICMDLRHSKRVFGLSALTGYLVVVGLLLLFRAPLEVIFGVSVLVASWSASRPSRACPECGGRIPLLVVSRSVRIVVKPFRENRNPGESFLSGRLEGH